MFHQELEPAQQYQDCRQYSSDNSHLRFLLQAHKDVRDLQILLRSKNSDYNSNKAAQSICIKASAQPSAIY